MTTKRLALSLLTIGMLAFGAASCDVMDPYEPGTSGSSTGSRTSDGEAGRPDERKISLNGNLHKLDMNGVVSWGFESDAQVRYEIISLPEAYQHDGLRVHIEAVVDNSAVAQGYGKRVKLIDIDPIGTPAHPMHAPSHVMMK
jgi:hypothetical protein